MRRNIKDNYFFHVATLVYQVVYNFYDEELKIPLGPQRGIAALEIGKRHLDLSKGKG